MRPFKKHSSALICATIPYHMGLEGIEKYPAKYIGNGCSTEGIFFTGSLNKSIDMWDIRTPTCVSQMRIHNSAVTSLIANENFI